MYAITGISGQVGSACAHYLLQDGHAVRAVVRQERKAAAWKARGCEVAVADMDDGIALSRAFAGTRGVFVLVPPLFDPEPGFPEVRRWAANVYASLKTTRPAQVVMLSSVGAQATSPNLLQQLGLVEQTLLELPSPVSLLRAAWFMENARWDVAGACCEGLIRSHLQPLDRAIPMVATDDIGHAAAALLTDAPGDHRVVELEGPSRISPRDIAAAFTRALRRPVHAEAVPRGQWEAQFRAQGMRHPLPRMQMLDGFNAGWIRFEANGGGMRGSTPLQTVIDALLAEPARG